MGTQTELITSSTLFFWAAALRHAAEVAARDENFRFCDGDPRLGIPWGCQFAAANFFKPETGQPRPLLPGGLWFETPHERTMAYLFAAAICEYAGNHSEHEEILPLPRLALW